MKKIQNYFKVAGIVLLITGVFTSCKKDEQPSSAGKTIVDIVNTDANFSLLKKAVERAGLGSALSTGSLTVFAPDNAAFAASDIDAADIDALPVADVANILKYHVVGTKVVSGSVPVRDTVNTLLGTNVYASKNANGVFPACLETNIWK